MIGHALDYSWIFFANCNSYRIGRPFSATSGISGLIARAFDTASGNTAPDLIASFLIERQRLQIIIRRDRGNPVQLLLLGQLF